MDQEKICGLFIGLFGASFLFGISETIAAGFQANLPFSQIFTLLLCLKLLAALAAGLAGAAALTELKGGVSAAFVAVLAMFALTFAPAMIQASGSIGAGPILKLFLLVSLFLGLLISAWRTSEPVAGQAKQSQPQALARA